MSIPAFEEIIVPNDQTDARAQHLASLGELIGNVYPNKFDRSALSGSEDTITNILNFPAVANVVTEIKAVVATLAERERPPAEIKDALNARLKALGNVRIAGRMAVPPRVMGKAAFVHLSDGINKLQIYCRKDDFVLLRNDAGGELDAAHSWEAFALLDHGDFVGVDGYLFITNTGELSVHVEKLQFLAKAMLPMPDKMHGIADAEIRQRQRYYDLIGSSLQVASDGLTTREVFEVRAKTISSLRRFLEDHGYIEVETPMLTPKATGAAAKPFKTHHNALDIDLYARIAPELYLKRLVVGGFEKVYELNRNFRNEGISYKHNPEFTMLEFYCAYMDVEGMMNFCEEMMRESVQKATGGLTVNYEGNVIDFSTFERVPMAAKVRFLCDQIFPANTLPSDWIDDASLLHQVRIAITEAANRPIADMQGKRHHLDIDQGTKTEVLPAVRMTNAERARMYFISEPFNFSHDSSEFQGELDWNKDIEYLFDFIVEENLVQPTFIIDYPKSISPLSKASPADPDVAERFELFINGMEVANGFSELNDPKEQYERFIDQMGERERGDEEAMVLDEDYIRALSYGMPPAAGIGIGIDRLVMLLTNKHSIRDVILFPHMRPEKGRSEAEEEVAA